MNRLFVAYKPPFISSNAYLFRLKRRYRVKKAGFSGTLDPFACGTLIVAFGSYTKLFPYLKKYPKVYRATLWLGASSPTLDIERVEHVQEMLPLPSERVKEAVESFKGSFTYIPPKFSAKKVGGKRAYKLALSEESLDLKPVTSQIHSIRLLTYRHPFVTFEAEVSEGTYIRSLGEHIAKKLGTTGALSYLERLREGAFVYEDERALDPLDYLITRPNSTHLSPQQIFHGTKLTVDDLEIKEDGLYHLVFEDFFAIIEIHGGKVTYKLNQMERYANTNSR